MAKKVLIVDDEPDIRTSIMEMVEKQGFGAETVPSGKKALEKLGKEKFDLVLLDMFMPEMSGRQVLEKIRASKELKRQKVAFLTVARLTEAGEDKIRELKPAAYILKPMDLKEFSAKLKGLLK